VLVQVNIRLDTRVVLCTPLRRVYSIFELQLIRLHLFVVSMGMRIDASIHIMITVIFQNILPISRQGSSICPFYDTVAISSQVLAIPMQTTYNIELFMKQHLGMKRWEKLVGNYHRGSCFSNTLQ
jgi:hypothetical protein